MFNVEFFKCLLKKKKKKVNWALTLKAPTGNGVVLVGGFTGSPSLSVFSRFSSSSSKMWLQSAPPPPPSSSERLRRIQVSRWAGSCRLLLLSVCGFGSGSGKLCFGVSTSDWCVMFSRTPFARVCRSAARTIRVRLAGLTRSIQTRNLARRFCGFRTSGSLSARACHS